MQQFLLDIQTRITTKVSALKYVDEDWGQLDYFSQHPPVQYPCCLFDIGDVTWTNQGKKQQSGTANIVITVANLKLSNTSAKAPIGQKNNAWGIHSTIIQAIHQSLHGYMPKGSIPST